MSLLVSTKNTRSILINSERFIRSDVPYNITDSERDWLIDHNIRTIVDLRTLDEQSQKPCVLQENNAFHYITLSVTGGNTIPESTDKVAESYLNMVDDVMTQIIETIMHAPTNVMYFCNAGKDRTGVVTAILLSYLGFDDQYIIDDYLLSGINLKNDLNTFAKNNSDIDIEVITPHKEYIEPIIEWARNNR